MCGIAGFAGYGIAEDVARARVRDMCDAIVHRGPDSDGYFVEGQVALGMRRLSVIDVAGGRQPISNADGTTTVVFNGEIYNHRALRARLESRGYRFKTRSDTEVLVHLYDDLGDDMVGELRGMFAFSIWDSKRQRLFAARDQTGMKPFYYYGNGKRLAFCSELRSLVRLHPGELEIEPAAVFQYLSFGYVPHPMSIFRNARKLPPGHSLVWTLGSGATIARYWRAPVPASLPRSEDELAEELEERLDHAVSSHLEADVPLGAFLSGGLDSSTVVALMARQASGRVRTFSIGFSEDEYDESTVAREVAAALGTEHTDLILDPKVESTFESIVSMFDEPFSDSSAIPTFLVAQLARQSVTVSLSGDGGDELFGGYSRYREVLGQTPLGMFGRFLGALGLMMPHAVPGRNKLVDFGRSRLGRYARTVLEPLRQDEGGVALPTDPVTRLGVEELLRDYFREECGEDFASAMMLIDLETYLPGDILTKVDRTSMAVSLEARVPLLDLDLVEFSLSIPGQQRVNRAGTKQLFRRVIKGMVPDIVLSQPKRGFEIPLGRWFRGPLRGRLEALRSPSEKLQEFVCVKALNRLVGEHAGGRRDHSNMLWRLMVLERWLGGFARGDLANPPSIPKL